MDTSRFDELTKALATSTTRRKALQRIGGTLAGSLLAAWPFTQALAAGGGNSACAHFCAAVFGADTPAAGQCTSDAAHGTGLCYTCGPASSGGTQPICCLGGSGDCTSYANATCCVSGQICQDGTCVTPTTTTTPAPTLYKATCTCTSNDTTTFSSCETSDACQSVVADSILCAEFCASLTIGSIVKSFTCVAC